MFLALYFAQQTRQLRRALLPPNRCPRTLRPTTTISGSTVRTTERRRPGCFTAPGPLPWALLPLLASWWPPWTPLEPSLRLLLPLRRPPSRRVRAPPPPPLRLRAVLLLLKRRPGPLLRMPLATRLLQLKRLMLRPPLLLGRLTRSRFVHTSRKHLHCFLCRLTLQYNTNLLYAVPVCGVVRSPREGCRSGPQPAGDVIAFIRAPLTLPCSPSSALHRNIVAGHSFRRVHPLTVTRQAACPARSVPSL